MILQYGLQKVLLCQELRPCGVQSFEQGNKGCIRWDQQRAGEAVGGQLVVEISDLGGLNEGCDLGGGCCCDDISDGLCGGPGRGRLGMGSCRNRVR